MPVETPVVYPSYEPDPTPTGALPPRTDVEINPNVVERPGVPPELHDRYWWTPYGDAGLLGTTAQIGLPAGERILTVDDDLVVSTVWSELQPEVILVRDFATGRLLRQIASGVAAPQAEVVAGRLFWTGVIGADDPNKVLDGGVWSTDPRVRETPRQIVAPGRPLGGALCGRNLVVSPSGLTLGATASCFGWKGWTDIIDVASQTRTRRISETNIRALTDDTYLAPDATPSDGLTYGQGGITAYDIATEAVRWRFPDRADVDRFALYDAAAVGNAFVVLSGWDLGDDAEFRLTIFNPITGQHRLLTRQASSWDALSFDRNASTREFLVLDYGWDDLAISGKPISLLRVSDGVFLGDAFVIDPPFLCSDAWCFRD